MRHASSLASWRSSVADATAQSCYTGSITTSTNGCRRSITMRRRPYGRAGKSRTSFTYTLYGAATISSAALHLHPQAAVNVVETAHQLDFVVGVKEIGTTASLPLRQLGDVGSYRRASSRTSAERHLDHGIVQVDRCGDNATSVTQRRSSATERGWTSAMY